MRPGVIARASSLASILTRDPQEFVERVGAIIAGRVEPLRHRAPEYDAVTWTVLEHQLAQSLGTAFTDALGEPELTGVEQSVADAAARLRQGPIEALHNGDALLARCCYAAVRATRPALVVETGVAHGVTSAYILAALRANGHGVLHSIDLPPHNAGAADRVGAFVDSALRERWTLHRGWAHKLLPPLVSQLGTIDVFVHDSLHTYRNMRLEFETVWDGMRAGGVIIADDIEGNAAFLELQRRAPQLWAACRQAEKPALFGVMVR